MGGGALTRAGRRFGEEGGVLSHGSYPRLPDLPDQQVPQAAPSAHDEFLFITVDQACELWFKQVLYELEAARDAMHRGELWPGRGTCSAGYTSSSGCLSSSSRSSRP